MKDKPLTVKQLEEWLDTKIDQVAEIGNRAQKVKGSLPKVSEWGNSLNCIAVNRVRDGAILPLNLGDIMSDEEAAQCQT